MKDDQYIWEEFKNGKEYALAHIYNQNIDFLFCFGKRISKDEDLSNKNNIMSYLLVYMI